MFLQETMCLSLRTTNDNDPFTLSENIKERAAALVAMLRRVILISPVLSRPECEQHCLDFVPLSDSLTLSLSVGGACCVVLCLFHQDNAPVQISTQTHTQTQTQTHTHTLCGPWFVSLR